MLEKNGTKPMGKPSVATAAYQEATGALDKLSGLTHALKCLALSEACEERERAIRALSAFTQGECRKVGEQLELLYKLTARERTENGKEAWTAPAGEMPGAGDERAAARGQEG